MYWDLQSDSIYLVVVFEDVSGSAQVQHTIDDQLAVAGKVVALLLKKSDICLLLLLTLTWVERSRKRKRVSWEMCLQSTESGMEGEF